LFEQVLGRKQLGVEDNFFEQGGHSLKATRLLSLLYKQWQVKLDLRAIFTHPTVRSLATHLKQVGQSRYAAIAPVALSEHYPLSFASGACGCSPRWRAARKPTTSRPSIISKER
jgi:fengycin family lipopeptide synthetase D